jgi:cellulose 1,4-beta-cellobiosidase
LSGIYTPAGTTPFESFIIESVEGSVNVSFFVDNFSIVGEVDEQPEVPVGEGLASLVDFPIGVAVAAGSGGADILTNAARQNIVRQEFDQIVAENIMKMSYMYSGSNFSFTNADRLVNWAAQNGKSVHGHALVWHPSYQLPSWATDNNANFRRDYERHIDTVAAHFAGKVLSWDVVNEALFDAADDDGRGSANGYRQSVFYRQYGGPGFIDEAFRRARAADPTAELYYNDFNTEENGAKTTALVSLVQRLLQNGVPIDGVGFQMHVMNDYPSIANIRASLQKIVDLSPTLKIKISELDVRLNNPYDGNSSNDYTNRSDCAVSCAGLDRQKARYKEIIQAYLDIVPPARRGGVVVWGIADPDSWFYTHQNLPDWPLLFNDSLQKKPAYQGVAEALATVPRTSSSAASSSRPSSSLAPSSSSRSSSSLPVISTSSSSSSVAVTSSSSSVVMTSSSRSSSSIASSSSRTSSSVGSVGPRLDNPFVDARWYVDPIWSAKAQAEPNGSKIANYNTAVWMDRIGAIAPEDGSWGLRDHLDAALDQNANLIQVVVYDLPNRDCHALASNGELKQTAEGSARYRNEYVDVIAGIFSDPKYASLRIIAIIEPDSLPNLVTNLSTPACQEATDPTHGYVANTRYTLSKLYPISNVYSYVDIGHSGWLGWTDNFGKAVTLIGDAIKGATGGVNSIAGFVSNTSGYTPLYEPFLDSLANSAFPGSGGGTQTRQAKFYEWNPHFSEVSFVQAWRTAMIASGFPSTIGMLVDTSRNGWGGANRPTAQSTSTTLDTFIDQSRIDRRAHRGNWCNQPGGVGERPQVAPVAGVDAYVWVKPPGESDGAASQELSYDPIDPAKGFDRNCDPTYTNAAGTTTGAMANAPVAGRWFKEGFKVLVDNAYPALD